MVDRRDAFSRRHGFSPTPHQPHRSFGRRLEEGFDENAEDMRRLRERWRFDEDDDPLVVPEGIDEQDRVLVDDFSPKYLRHMMTLLTEADQQHINNDATLVLVSTEGRQQSVLPFRTGTQQPFIRRDVQTPRTFTNGISQLNPSRQMSSVPLSAVPNGVPIAMQTHMKALQPQSATPRISHTTALRPPGPPQIANIPAAPLCQTPLPHVNALPTVSANGAIGGSPSPAPPPSDSDSVKLVSAPNGNVTKGATANGTNQLASDLTSSPATESQLPALPIGSPVRQKADVQQPVSIPLNGYHIPINGYAIPNAAYMHSRPPNGLTAQQMQNLKLALAQGQDVNAVMHGTQGRPIQTPYVGHLVPNGTHYNMQMAAGATNLNLKLASGRQWSGVAPPLQQTSSLGNQQQDANTAPSIGSPNLSHATAGALPTRTPSVNGTRGVSRPGAMGSPVGHMMPGGQYAAHSVSPRLQNAGSSPLPNPTSLPPHQSPPRQPLTPTMKMASPSLQHQQAVPSSQGGY